MSISDCGEGGRFQFAVLDSKENLIGYISYWVDYYSSRAYGFGTFSFEKGKYIMAKEMFTILEELLNTMHAWEVSSNMDIEEVIRKIKELCDLPNSGVDFSGINIERRFAVKHYGLNNARVQEGVMITDRESSDSYFVYGSASTDVWAKLALFGYKKMKEKAEQSELVKK